MMGYEDTVIESKVLGKIKLNGKLLSEFNASPEMVVFIEGIALAQAEKSFNAGLELAINKCGIAFDSGKKAGRKQAVEWIKGNAASVNACVKHSPFNVPIWAISQEQWQAQLKDWGIE